jgi:hypothetical protein
MIIFCAVVRGVVQCTAVVGAAMVLYGCYDLARMAFAGWKE